MPAAASASMVKSQRTGEADLSDEQFDESGSGCDCRAVAVGPDRDVRVGDPEPGGHLAQGLDGGSHEPGMEGAGDLERNDASAGRRRLAEGLECGQLAGDDDLTSAVEVGGLEPEFGELREQFGLVRADDGAHAGGDLRGGRGYRTAAFAHQNHRIRFAQDAGGGCRGEFTDRVARDARELRDPRTGLARVVAENCTESQQ